jgi:hypothetical protein
MNMFEILLSNESTQEDKNTAIECLMNEYEFPFEFEYWNSIFKKIRMILVAYNFFSDLCFELLHKNKVV